MKTREGTVPCEGCGEATSDLLGPYGYLCEDCEGEERRKANNLAYAELYGPRQEEQP